MKTDIQDIYPHSPITYTLIFNNDVYDFNTY